VALARFTIVPCGLTHPGAFGFIPPVVALLVGGCAVGFNGYPETPALLVAPGASWQCCTPGI